MKKVIGYGYKLSKESNIKAIADYAKSGELSLDKSRKETLKAIKEGKWLGYISKNSRPKIFKVTVEIL